MLTLARLLRFVVAGVAGSFLGLIVGAMIGGNFATDFVFMGQRGYEASGVLGAMIGFVVAGALSALAIGQHRRAHRT